MINPKINSIQNQYRILVLQINSSGQIEETFIYSIVSWVCLLIVKKWRWAKQYHDIIIDKF